MNPKSLAAYRTLTKELATLALALETPLALMQTPRKSVSPVLQRSETLTLPSTCACRRLGVNRRQGKNHGYHPLNPPADLSTISYKVH